MGSTHETPGRFAPGESGVVGVFGMDLEGLEVVSGCSKRFIWKLTDISMNSCVDLLSPPAWWCGLKSVSVCLPWTPRMVTTCVVVWIEIFELSRQHQYSKSPPAWWCGLKSQFLLPHPLPGYVTTCVVVWIEIINMPTRRNNFLSPPAWWCGLK